MLCVRWRRRLVADAGTDNAGAKLTTIIQVFLRAERSAVGLTYTIAVYATDGRTICCALVDPDIFAIRCPDHAAICAAQPRTVSYAEPVSDLKADVAAFKHSNRIAVGELRGGNFDLPAHPAGHRGRRLAGCGVYRAKLERS